MVRFSKLMEAIVDSEKDPEVPKTNLTLMYGPNTDIAPSTAAPSTKGTDLRVLVQAGRSNVLACSFDEILSYSHCSNVLSGVMSTTEDKRLEVAAQTVDQSACPDWYRVRKTESQHPWPTE